MLKAIQLTFIWLIRMTSFVCAFGDEEIDSIEEVDALSGVRLNTYEEYKVYPANLFLTSKETQEIAIRKIQEDLRTQVQLFEDMGEDT